MAPSSFCLVVAAAGSSTRFSNPKAGVRGKKEFAQLGGRAVLAGACAPFLKVPGLAAIAVSCDPALVAQTRQALGDIATQKAVPVLLVDGGATRQRSVFNALRALEASGLGRGFVAIHDGARPFVALENILSILEAARSSSAGAAVGAIPIADAVARVDGGAIVESGIDKSSLRLVQTPQIFRFDAILRAHELADEAGESFPDDASVFDRFIGQVAVVQGDERNIKITWPGDLGGPRWRE